MTWRITRKRQVRRDREKKRAVTEARKARESYLPKFGKLAFQAQRSGAKGEAALAVLQDALLENYGPQFRAAIRQAKARRKNRGERALVIFGPTMERAYHKYPNTRDWYTKARWPFSITTNPHKDRPTAVVVWDSAPVCGFKAHHWVRRRQERAREPKGALEIQLFKIVARDGWITPLAIYLRAVRSLERKGQFRRVEAPDRPREQPTWKLTPQGFQYASAMGWSPVKSSYGEWVGSAKRK